MNNVHMRYDSTPEYQIFCRSEFCRHFPIRFYEYKDFVRIPSLIAVGTSLWWNMYPRLRKMCYVTSLIRRRGEFLENLVPTLSTRFSIFLPQCLQNARNAWCKSQISVLCATCTLSPKPESEQNVPERTSKPYPRALLSRLAILLSVWPLIDVIYE